MKTVLVIRKTDEFSRILSEKGFETINLPLIETKPCGDLRGFQARLERAEMYDGIFLTSLPAAEVFAAQLREKNITFAGRVYVLGKRAFDALRAENLNLNFFPEANTAREMLEKIPPAELRDKRFLFIRGDRSLRAVPEFLENKSRVDEEIVYRTSEIEVGIAKIKTIREKFERREIAAACFFSPSAAESFWRQFGGEPLDQTCVATLGKTTAEFFAARNLKVEYVSPRASVKDFARGLSEYLTNGKRKMENEK